MATVKKTFEQLKDPWDWKNELGNNLQNLNYCREMAMQSEAVCTLFTPERTALRISELATLLAIRIEAAPKVVVDGQETTGMKNLVLAGGGVPFASALGFEIHRQNPRTEYRTAFSKISRYGNVQTGKKDPVFSQPPIPGDIEGMFINIVDDLVDRGHTIKSAARIMMEEGIPYSPERRFIENALAQGVLSIAQYNRLIDAYSNKPDLDFSIRRARPNSISATVLADKQFYPDLTGYITHVDIGMYAPKVWLQRMGMDGKNESGRWGEGIVVSGAQEVKYAQEMSDILDLVGDLAVKSMDGKDPIFWLDETGNPTQLPKQLY